MQHGRRASIKIGNQAIIKSLQHSYRDRRNKKRDIRSSLDFQDWIAARDNGTTYGKLINGLKTAKSTLNRKMLAEIAVSDEKGFLKNRQNCKSNSLDCPSNQKDLRNLAEVFYFSK